MKTKLCSIVVYGQTLVKRENKGVAADVLRMSNLRCIHPDDFDNKEDGEMVEVFVSSPWISRVVPERGTEEEEQEEADV